MNGINEKEQALAEAHVEVELAKKLDRLFENPDFIDIYNEYTVIRPNHLLKQMGRTGEKGEESFQKKLRGIADFMRWIEGTMENGKIAVDKIDAMNAEGEE